jgi:hypothetical protein
MGEKPGVEDEEAAERVRSNSNITTNRSEEQESEPAGLETPVAGSEATQRAQLNAVNVKLA